MAISYSISLRPNPLSKDSDLRAYPEAQHEETMSIKAFSDHISSHGSVYSRDVVEGVLTKAVDCMREMLLEGKIIQLGDLGDFYVTLNSRGTATAADFTSANIKKVNVIWRKSSYFQNLIKNATFKLVAPRKAQADALAEQKGTAPVNPEPTTPTEKKTVKLTVMPQGFGKVEGNGEFPVDSNAVIRAIPNINYSFVGWSDGSMQPARTIKLRENLNLVANFVAGAADPTKLYITAIAKNPDQGTVSGSGAYSKGDMVILSAEPEDGYMFTRWTNGKDTIDENPYEFNIDASGTWVAEFEEE